MAEQTTNLLGFDNVEALVSAYQKLKEDYDTLVSKHTPTYEKSDWRDTVESFMTDYPEAQEIAGEIARILVESPEIRDSERPLERAYIAILSERKSADKLANDDKFLAEYIYPSDKIRDKIISEYIAELNSNTPSVMAKGGETFITPPKSPKNLKEAMNLAEKLLNR